jgi:hypothetical protein
VAVAARRVLPRRAGHRNFHLRHRGDSIEPADCLCPCHHYTSDETAAADIEHRCPCDKVTRYLENLGPVIVKALQLLKTECNKPHTAPDCTDCQAEASEAEVGIAETFNADGTRAEALCPCSRPGYDHREPCPGCGTDDDVVHKRDGNSGCLANGCCGNCW